MSNNLRILPTHQTTSNHTMPTVNCQSISTAPTVISVNIEGLTASKASMLSDMCKREHCHCLCLLQESHRAPHLARQNIPGMTLITKRPQIKYGSAILTSSDLKVKGVSVWEQDNVELIIEMPGVVVHSVYKPPNEKFVLPAPGHGKLTNIVNGDINSHSTTWGYTNTDDNGEAVEQ